MAKSFQDLVDKTSTENSKKIAEKRTEELIKEYNMDKITWLDVYNFLYHKAHDLRNLGKFNWSEEVKVIDPETGKQYTIEPVLTKEHQGELFCNPAFVLKIEK